MTCANSNKQSLVVSENGADATHEISVRHAGDSQFVDNYDVLIIGAGLAGLSLSRQLLLNSDKKVLLLDKRSQIPSPHQKVGELHEIQLALLLEDRRARESQLRRLRPGLHTQSFEHCQLSAQPQQAGGQDAPP